MTQFRLMTLKRLPTGDGEAERLSKTSKQESGSKCSDDLNSTVDTTLNFQGGSPSTEASDENNSNKAAACLDSNNIDSNIGDVSEVSPSIVKVNEKTDDAVETSIVAEEFDSTASNNTDIKIDSTTIQPVTDKISNFASGNINRVKTESPETNVAIDGKSDIMSCVKQESDPVPAIKTIKLKTIKKELQALFKVHSKNSGDFSTGGLLSDLEMPCVPLIEIKDHGVLSFPFNMTIFESIKSFCQQSPYGLGEKTLIDTTVRNSLQIEPKNFEIKNENFSRNISMLIENKIKPALGLVGARVFGKVYKLLIYQSSGKFEEHRDTEKEDNMFGTLIVQLPSVFTGGDLIVKHNKSSRVYNNSCPGSSTHCMFVAHYASCLHELKEITSGYRVALVYSLCWDGNGLKPSPYVASTNAVRLGNLLNQYMDRPNVSYLCWALEYMYSDVSIKPGSAKFFKGGDKNVISGLINALDYDKLQFGRDRWELFIATANKKISECGDCGGCDGYGRWGGSCGDNDCGGDWEENERSCELDSFQPLTGNSNDEQKMSFDFNPKKNVLNKRDNCSKSTDSKYPSSRKKSSDHQSDEEFWGDNDIGEGCSGPSGNEGSNRERWYQKRVLILWRQDKSLMLKCKSSISDGIAHVLMLLHREDIAEGEQGFLFLMKSLDRVSAQKDIINLLEMSNILKKESDAVTLLTYVTKWGLPDERTGKVLTETAYNFPSKVIKSALTEILEKAKGDQIKNVLQFSDMFNWMEPTAVLQTVINHVLKSADTSPYSYSWCYRSNDKARDEFTSILKYMIDKAVFPEKELELLITKMESLIDLQSAIELIIEHENNDVLIQLLMRFVEISSEKYSPNDKQKLADGVSISNTFKILLSKHQKNGRLFQPISMLCTMIISLHKNLQELLTLFVAQILTLYDKENMFDSLNEACNVRFTYLQEIARKGTPKMTWKQPNAVVPGHPQVEAFLRGPSETFVYRDFNDLPHARNWANKHRNDKGCFMKITPTGRGKTAACEVVKTKKGYDKLLEIYKKEMTEYEKLLKVCSGSFNAAVGLQEGNQNSSTDLKHEIIILD